MEKKKKSFTYKISIIIFVLSFALVGYSLFNIFQNESKADETLALWDELQETEIATTKEQSQGIDNSTTSNKSEITKSSNETEKTIPNTKATKNLPADIKLIGKIAYPKSSVAVALIDGHTSRDLDYGAVHHYTTPYPGEEGNSLILGHRDGVFRFLKNVKIGDTIVIETQDKTSTYIIQETKITEPNDPIFYKKYDHPSVTLLTCYPFYYIGSAPQRFIAVGKLVEE